MSDYAQFTGAFPWFVPTVFFFFGACVGSFLNVCILRLPNGKSILRPPSTCACGKRIAWFDNIPVLSWFLLGGKARCCKARFSFRYPFVELLTACIFLYLALNFSLEMAIVGAVFSSLMIATTFIDIDTLHLPDFLTVGGMVLGVIISCALPSLHGAQMDGYPFFVSSIKSFLISATGVAAGSGILYWMRLLGTYAFRREAMGEGDIVLIGCIGAFCGWQGAFFAIFGGSVLGCVLIFPIIMLSKMFAAKKQGGKKKSKKDAEDSEEDASGMIPFGPWLCLGGVVYYLFASEFVDAYLANFTQNLFN